MLVYQRVSHSKKMRIQFALAMASDSRLRELPSLSVWRTLKGNPATTKSCPMFPLFGHFHYINQLRQILYKSSYCWFEFTHQPISSSKVPIAFWLWSIWWVVKPSPHHDAPAAANISGVTPSSSGSEARVARCSSIRCTVWVPAVMQPRWETPWDGLYDPFMATLGVVYSWLYHGNPFLPILSFWLAIYTIWRPDNGVFNIVQYYGDGINERNRTTAITILDMLSPSWVLMRYSWMLMIIVTIPNCGWLLWHTGDKMAILWRLNGGDITRSNYK